MITAGQYGNALCAPVLLVTWDEVLDEGFAILDRAVAAVS